MGSLGVRRACGYYNNRMDKAIEEAYDIPQFRWPAEVKDSFKLCIGA